MPGRFLRLRCSPSAWSSSPIVEYGTRRELCTLGGRCRQLHDKQHAVEHDRDINPGEDFTPEPPLVAAGRRDRW